LKWLFWFCEGSACVSGKTKCAICASGFFIFLSARYFYHCRCFFRVSANGPRLSDGGDAR
jgi:hypothetical protein